MKRHGQVGLDTTVRATGNALRSEQELLREGTGKNFQQPIVKEITLLPGLKEVIDCLSPRGFPELVFE